MNTSSERRLFRKVAALLLGVVGAGALLFGLVIGLSTVYGPPQAPSSDFGGAAMIDCGTPFSPNDDPYGDLTDYGLKECQATVGDQPHIAVALTVFGGLALLAGIVFAFAAGAVLDPPPDVLQAGAIPVITPAVDPKVIVQEPIGHLPEGFSTGRVAGRSIMVNAIGENRYLRVRDLTSALGMSDDALLALIPAHADNVRKFDTKKFSVNGWHADVFIEAPAARDAFADLTTVNGRALAAFAEALIAHEA